MSELNAQFVKRGEWLDQSEGGFLGRTITTDTRTSTILIAVLAVFSSLATTHLWNLVTFLVHQVRADGVQRDGLFRQQQALLRTLPPPSSILADYIKLWLSWRRRSDKALARSVIYWILALLFTISTILTSIASSFVVSNDTIQTLVDSDFCGFLNVQPIGEFATWNAIDAGYLTSIYPLTRRLVDDCYLNGEAVPALCDTLTRPNIPFTTEHVACPFESSICVGDDKPAISLDSGFLDLNQMFGLNLPSQDRVKFRKRTTCAILPYENHTTIINATDYPPFVGPPLDGEQVRLYQYATMIGQDPQKWANATFYQSLMKGNVSEDFTIRSMVTYTDPTRTIYSAFEPSSEMDIKDGDIVLRYIGKNKIHYGQPVNDPVFSAHKKMTYKSYGVQDEATIYYSDEPGTVLGCTEQYQFCVAQSGKADACSPLGPLPDSKNHSLSATASLLQLAVLQHVITSSFLFDLSNADSVLASSLVRTAGLIREGLPDDQWINEVIGWESQVWAGLQILIPDYAIGAKARDPDADFYVMYPNTTAEKALCGMQRMPKAGGFVNINVFGLAFILTFALLVTVADILVLKFFVYLSKFRRALAPRIDRWIQDGVLQLQRRAYEAQGGSNWVRLDQEIPVTMDRELLEDFSVDLRPKGRRGEGDVGGRGRVERLRTADSEATVIEKGGFKAEESLEIS